MTEAYKIIDHTYDTVVVGAGGSGLRAAIEVAEAGVDVIAVGKRPKDDAHTSLAAGGINAALAEIAHHGLGPARHPEIILQELVGLVLRPPRGKRDLAQLCTRPR